VPFLKKNLFLAFNVVLAMVLLLVISSSIDFGALEKVLANANLLFVAFAAFFYLLTHFISALRYKMLHSPKFTVLDYFRLHMRAMLASDATPGRVGYSLFIFDLRKRGMPGGKAAKLMGVSFASDFLVRGLLALAAIWLFSSDFGQAGVFVVAASIIAFALLFFKSKSFASIISKFPYYGKRLEGAYQSVFKQKTSTNQLLLSIGFSFAGAVARGAEWVFVFQALGLNLFAVQATVLSALLTALSFIPLSVAGFGVQEGGGIVLLSSLLGFNAFQAAGAMLLVRAVDVAADVLVGGLFFLTSPNSPKK